MLDQDDEDSDLDVDLGEREDAETLEWEYETEDIPNNSGMEIEPEIAYVAETNIEVISTNTNIDDVDINSAVASINDDANVMIPGQQPSRKKLELVVGLLPVLIHIAEKEYA